MYVICLCVHINTHTHTHTHTHTNIHLSICACFAIVMTCITLHRCDKAMQLENHLITPSMHHLVRAQLLPSCYKCNEKLFVGGPITEFSYRPAQFFVEIIANSVISFRAIFRCIYSTMVKVALSQGDAYRKSPRHT